MCPEEPGESLFVWRRSTIEKLKGLKSEGQIETGEGIGGEDKDLKKNTDRDHQQPSHSISSDTILVHHAEEKLCQEEGEGNNNDTTNSIYTNNKNRLDDYDGKVDRLTKKKNVDQVVKCVICLTNVPSILWGTHVNSNGHLTIEMSKGGRFCSKCNFHTTTMESWMDHIGGHQTSGKITSNNKFPLITGVPHEQQGPPRKKLRKDKDESNNNNNNNEKNNVETSSSSQSPPAAAADEETCTEESRRQC